MSRDSLSKLQGDFSHWRSTKRSRHVPDALRSRAVELLSDHKVSHVLQALGINYAMLSRWRDEQSSKTEQSLSSASMDFVSLPVEESSQRGSILTITHRQSDGSSLSIEGELPLTQWKETIELLHSLGREG